MDGATLADLGTGAALLAAGAAALTRRPARPTGALLLATGAAWLAGSAVEALVFLHRGPLFHLLLSYSRVRVDGRPRQAIVAAGYVTGAIEPLGASDPLTFGMCALVAGAAAERWLRAGGIERRAAGSAAAAALIVCGALGWGVLARASGVAASTVLGVYEVAVVIAAVGLAADVLLGGWSRGVVAGLLLDVGRLERAAPLADEIGRAVGDRSLTLAFRTADGYRDEAGRPVVLPGRRAVTRISDDALLVHDPAVLADPELASAASAAARLALGNARLHGEVAARVEELAASARRLVTAGDDERRRVAATVEEGAEARLGRAAERLAGVDPELAHCGDRGRRRGARVRRRAAPAAPGPRRARGRARRPRPARAGAGRGRRAARSLRRRRRVDAVLRLLRGARQRRQARGRVARAGGDRRRQRPPRRRDQRRRRRRRRPRARLRPARPRRSRRGARRRAGGRQPSGRGAPRCARRSRRDDPHRARAGGGPGGGGCGGERARRRPDADARRPGAGPVVLLLAVAAALAGVGAAAWHRRPQSAVGPLLLGAAATWCAAQLTTTRGVVARVHRRARRSARRHPPRSRWRSCRTGAPARCLAFATVGLLGVLSALVFDPQASDCVECPTQPPARPRRRRALRLRSSAPGCGSGSPRSPGCCSPRRRASGSRRSPRTCSRWRRSTSTRSRAATSPPTPPTARCGRSRASRCSASRRWSPAEPVRERRARARLARLVVELESRPGPRGLQEVLGSVLGDHDLRIAYPLADGRRLDAVGRPAEPAPRAGRHLAARRPSCSTAPEPARRSRGRRRGRRVGAPRAARRAPARGAAGAARGPAGDPRRGSSPPATRERRRLEHDLHDGAQQRLATLAVSIEVARTRGERRPRGNARRRATSTSARALAALREVAHGLVPPVLADEGLGPAVEAFAETADAVRRRGRAADRRALRPRGRGHRVPRHHRGGAARRQTPPSAPCAATAG